MAVIDSASNHVPLDLSGARGKIVVTGALGIVAKVEIDGERARPERGGWAIPLKKGGASKLVVKGFLPGFQRFLWEGEPVLVLGSHVRKPEKIVMFAPFLLMLAWVFLAPVSLALFLMNIPVVKNPLMPRALRIALPIVNTLAAFVAFYALGTMVGPKD